LISKIYLATFVMHQYPNLKIAGIADIPRDPYYYAVRKDYPELVSILNNAIQSIPNDRVNAIVQKWFSVQIEYRPNWSEILKWAFVIGGAFTLLLGLSLLWNRRLSREIDKRKQAEEEQRKITDELERSNVDLQQFAYVASHDLQEPLRMISSYLQLIERRYHDKLDSDANDFIHYAVDGANRLRLLIDGLLEFSRIKTHGKLFESVNIKKILDRVCRDLDPLIVESDAVVRYGQMPIIQADEAQIARLFQNLIQNALKFRREGIQPLIEITAEKTGGHHVFRVRDNGIGIEALYFERIFIIFQRLHTREQYPGMGIGLSICKRIVERHRGTIWVESAPDEGSSFCFSLPEGIQ
jgi:signal transduction histidine kinase